MERELRAGTIIGGRFVLSRTLGAGNSGTVWLAEDHTQAGRAVAVKILHRRFEDQPLALERLAREAQLLARLDHPHVAQPITVEVNAFPAYLAMEYVPGQALHEVIAARAGQHFSIGELLSIFGDLCSAVGYAHARSIIHRDLKPQNVMLARRGGRWIVKVLDFGVARLLDTASDGATTHGRTIGSLFYMSPEQTRGEPAGPASDVFALASMLFELVTLRRCWAWDRDGGSLPAFTTHVNADGTNSVGAVFERINHGPRPRATRYREGLSPLLDEVLARAWSVQPEHRPATVESLLERVSATLMTTLSEPLPELTRATQVTPVELAGPEEELSTAGGRLTRTRVDLPTVVRRESSPSTRPTPRLPTLAVSGGVEALLDPPRVEDLALTPLAQPAIAETRVSVPAEAPVGATMLTPTPSASVRVVKRWSPEARRSVLTAVVAVCAALPVAGFGYWLRGVQDGRAAPRPEPSPAPAVVATQSSPEPTPIALGPSRAEVSASPAAPSPRPTPSAEVSRAGSRRAERPVAEAPRSALRALLAEARARPDDTARVGALAQAITRAAEKVRNTDARTQIQRLAQAATMVHDLTALEDAFQDLARALDREGEPLP